MNELEDFINISKYAGERFDLVQAGGGNSSVKLDTGEMLIKASGFLLGDVVFDSGYSKVSTKEVAQIVKQEEVLNSESKRQRESTTSEFVRTATLDKENRPSIETLLHSFLLKYTLHTHPIVVNVIVIQKNWKEVLSDIFSQDEICLVAYQTPGIELAINLSKELEKFEDIPKIIFLQNHGLIITSDESSDIELLTEYVLSKIEKYLSIDMSKYKLTNSISKLLKKIKANDNISYLSEDIYLNEVINTNKTQFLSKPFCPDTLVFCGVACLEIDSLDNTKSLEKYLDDYYDLPKVLLFENKIFFIAKSVKKAKEMEEVFKFHVMVLIQNEKEENNFLPMEELAYLSNWEAEKYRQKI